jgi:site-specific DNA-methyltransferase (adenine-specific)
VSLYYEDDNVKLYHGDCLTEHREWLAADVLVTDPPYGMAYSGFGGRKGEPRRKTGPLCVIGDGDTKARDSALDAWGARPAIVFGKWSIERPLATRQVLIWDKSGNGPGMGALDLPWGPSFEEAYILGKGFTGKREGAVLRAQGFTSADANRPNHPTPKPVGLMERLIEKCPPGTVADPFSGSGSTLVAAKALGRKAIGVELEERYCEIAAKRLSQEAFDFSGLT